MKKVFAVISIVALISVMASCKEKRCACTWYRGDGDLTSHSLEPMEGITNCSDLDGQWLASDSATLIRRECVEEL